jgi:hypothetical protein
MELLLKRQEKPGALGQHRLGREYGPSQPWFFKVERGILEFGRDHDEHCFAAGGAKVVGATKNTEMPHDSGLRKWGRASKNDLPLLVKCCCYKALYECVVEVWRLRNADDRTQTSAGAHFLIVLVEELDDGDELVAGLRSIELAGEGLLDDLGGDMDALGSRLTEGRCDGCVILLEKFP